MAGTKFKNRNLNRFRKIYPGVRKTPVNSTISSKEVTMEETILSFTSESSKIYTFTQQYTQIPSVTISAAENINVYITSISTTTVTIECSSQITSDVHLQIMKIG